MMTHIIHHPNLKKSLRNLLNTLKSPVYPALIPPAFLPTFHLKTNNSEEYLPSPFSRALIFKTKHIQVNMLSQLMRNILLFCT